jgi:hypothetical protein
MSTDYAAGEVEIRRMCRDTQTAEHVWFDIK